jgi:signal transduction histidine kinase
MNKRTWPVFLIGLGSLLLLIFLPGITALRQSEQIYDDIRGIQMSHERIQSGLFDVERHVLQMSVTVRDFLLDNSPQTSSLYLQQFNSIRATVEKRLQLLAESTPRDQAGMFDRLANQLREYTSTMIPVFAWSPAERTARGTFFLREQQRPRRESILAITDEIGRLNAENFRTRYDNINASQRRFRRQMEVAVAFAVLLGAGIALATTIRIFALERHFRQQRLATERAEKELRGLSARLMQAQEDERRALSRELHDEVGQLVTALGIEVGTLERLRHETGDQFDRHLAQAKDLAKETLRTVRDMAVGLRPFVLDLGPEPALQWQARQFSRSTGTEASVVVDGNLPGLPDSYLTCVYRIVQEALTNSARHSKAKRVDISVTSSGSEISVTVRDDGVGLPENWNETRGLGLIGIEERARELGGTVNIGASDGKGVSIQVRLPVPEGAEA